MVTTILKSNRSARLAIDYSEKKVFEGNAAVVCVRNLPNSNLDTIYDTFESYESNPAISVRTRQFCFHMAVSPSETDELRDDQVRIVEYIDEMMERLGYGRQPYVVYRHNDIDREHFHVVSSRIAPNGRPVMRDGRYVGKFEGRQVLSIMKALAPVYGFTVGNDQQRLLEREMSETEWERVLATDSNKVDRIKRVFEEALKYNYTSFAQFKTVMSNMGIHVKKQRKGNADNLWFAVEDESGKVASVGFNAEYMLRTNAFERFDAAMSRNVADGTVDRRMLAKMQAVLEYSSRKAHTRKEFIKMCSECGIDFIPQEKGGHLVSYSVIDRRFSTVLSPSRLGRNVGPAALDELQLPEGGRVDELLFRKEDFDAIKRRMAELVRMMNERDDKKTKKEELTKRASVGTSRH